MANYQLLGIKKARETDTHQSDNRDYNKGMSMNEHGIHRSILKTQH